MLQSLDSQSCTHGPNAHKAAVGARKGDEWESAHFAAFPPALNYFLAQAIARLGQQHAIRDRPGRVTLSPGLTALTAWPDSA